MAYQEGPWWVAQCLEYDIAAQAKTLPALREEVERVLVGHLVVATELSREPFADIGPAPRRFWSLFDQARLRLESERRPVRLRGGPRPLPIQDLRIAELQPA